MSCLQSVLEPSLIIQNDGLLAEVIEVLNSDQNGFSILGVFSSIVTSITYLAIRSNAMTKNETAITDYGKKYRAHVEELVNLKIN